MEKTESEESELKSFRESNVYPLMPFLRKGIFHRTNIEGYKGIMQSGFISPNKGQFPFSYPQSEFYYGHSKSYICLFDFESSREEDYRINYLTWGSFFNDQKPITIVLKLNRQQLKDKLISNRKAPRLGEKEYKGYIPFVEVWYPEVIPLSAIDGYLVTCWNAKLQKIEIFEYSKEESEMLGEEIKSIEKMV